MKKAVVIGATGHVGTYLVPRLVRMGYQVTAISRGTRDPYTMFPEWREVERVQMDRLALEKTDGFGCKVAAMRPDVVVDMISLDYHSTIETVEALRRTALSHYLFASSIWEHGASFTVPADEDTPRKPIDDYGRDKIKSIEYLHGLYEKEKFPYTAVMPGHISGPGWTCINPTGNHDPSVFTAIAHGERIYVPNFGVECVHHVHADDVAQVFERAIRNREAALDQDFLAVSPKAITLRGYAEHMYEWFGKEADIEYLPWPEWVKVTADEEKINRTWRHITHCNNYSCDKARRLLGYAPQYSGMDAVHEAVRSMIERGVVTVG